MSIQGFWPVTLTDKDVTLRPLRYSDRTAWREVRSRNREWLRRWDATMPNEGKSQGQRPPSFFSMVNLLRREAKEGRVLPFAITLEGAFVGQLTVGGIWGGSSRSAYFGYWIDQKVAGRGIMTRAVNLAATYCFEEMKLHRIEINVRPENEASRAVAIKCGFYEESFRPRYLHIDGDWRDHISYVKFRDTHEHK